MPSPTTGTLYWLPRVLEADDERLTATHVLALVCLANHVDAGDQAFPSMARIAAAARCSERTARRVMADLAEWRYVERERRKLTTGLSTYLYTLLRDVAGPDTVTAPGPDSLAAPEAAGPDTLAGGTGQNCGRSGPDTQVAARKYPGEPPTVPTEPAAPSAPLVLIADDPAVPAYLDALPAAGAQGSRLPDAFRVSPAMRDWAAAECPGVNVVAATAEFADYWRAIPGARGRKTDWAATWRNWLRRVHTHHPARGTAAAPVSKRDAQLQADPGRAARLLEASLGGLDHDQLRSLNP